MRTALFARGGSCELLPRHHRVEHQQAHRAYLGAHLLDMRCAAGSWLAERRSPMTPAKKGGKRDGLRASKG